MNATTFGLADNEFAHLNPTDKEKLVRLMARLAEKSYRRGAVHATIYHCTQDELFDWRHLSLDMSPGLRSPVVYSIERLFEQNSDIERLGL